MKITTTNPIYVKQSTSSADAITPSSGVYKPIMLTPPSEIASQAAKKGLVWDKVKGGWAKAKELGLVDQAGQILSNVLSGKGIKKNKSTPVEQVVIADAPPQKKGMSTTTKVLIAVGIFAVIGGIVYATTNGSSKKA
jgi:hypothetical protein